MGLKWRILTRKALRISLASVQYHTAHDKVNSQQDRIHPVFENAIDCLLSVKGMVVGLAIELMLFINRLSGHRKLLHNKRVVLHVCVTER